MIIFFQKDDKRFSANYIRMSGNKKNDYTTKALFRTYNLDYT